MVRKGDESGAVPGAVTPGEHEIALERYRLLVDHTRDIILMFDAEGNIAEVNRAAVETYGYTRDELLSMNVADLRAPSTQPALHQQFGSALQGTLKFETKHICKDGSLIDVEVQSTSAADGSGRLVMSVIRDITERKRSEDALRASEEKFRSFMANSPMAVWITDEDGDIRYLSPAYYEIFGIPREFVSGPASEIYAPELLEVYLHNNRRVLTEDRPLHTVERGVRADGSLGEFIAVKFPLQMENGERLVAGLAYDITDRQRAEERYHALFRSMQEGLIVAELIESEIQGGPLDFVYLDMNPAAERILGMRREDVVGKRAMEIVPEEGRDVFELYAAVARTGEPMRHELYYAYLDQFHENFTFRPAPAQIAVLFWDITERKRAEERLRQYSETLEERVTERTRELARTNRELTIENRQRRKLEKERIKLLSELVRSQENERRRIARDLHDHVGQQMTALDLNIQMLLEVFGDRKALERQVSELRSITQQVGRDVDSLAWELRPATLDEHGFLPAVRRYIEDWTARSEVPVDFWAESFDEKGIRLEPEVETNLYRIVQEALNNVAKYAQATRVDILLDAREDHVRLIVEDNGEGFQVRDFQAVKNDRGTMGLIGMRERCSIIGGSFMIESNPGEGTSIFVQVPLQNNA